MTREQELDIISRAKKHPRFFAPLYELHFEKIFRFVHRKVGYSSIAGDLCSQTFEKAMLALPKYKDQGHPFSSWLYRIAANEVNMYYRKKGKVSTQELNEVHLTKLVEEFDFNIEREEQIEHLLVTLSELSESDQKLVEARFFDTLSFKEMGGLFGMKEDAVKMRTYRVLKTLRKMMEGGSNG